MKHWLLWFLAGTVSFVGGLLALLNPMSASIAATTLAGWALLIVGGLQGYSAWKAQALRGTVGAALVSGSALFMGVIILWGPIGDGGIIRILLALLLIVSGGAILWSARQLRGDTLFPAVLVAGGIPVLLGLILLTGFPVFIADNLGIIIGIELLALGTALVALSLRRKKTVVT